MDGNYSGIVCDPRLPRRGRRRVVRSIRAACLLPARDVAHRQELRPGAADLAPGCPEKIRSRNSCASSGSSPTPRAGREIAYHARRARRAHLQPCRSLGRASRCRARSLTDCRGDLSVVAAPGLMPTFSTTRRVAFTAAADVRSRRRRGAISAASCRCARALTVRKRGARGEREVLICEMTVGVQGDPRDLHQPRDARPGCTAGARGQRARVPERAVPPGGEPLELRRGAGRLRRAVLSSPTSSSR